VGHRKGVGKIFVESRCRHASAAYRAERQTPGVRLSIPRASAISGELARPFLGRYVSNIAADQLTKLNLELFRKASDETSWRFLAR
jgi:hypothetical protein